MLAEEPRKEPVPSSAVPPERGSYGSLFRARREAADMHLTGIAFSGGGIRSATFAVGILQGLASLGLLRRFDYLSTVSGGGYAGGWLASWMKRDGDVRNVELHLARSGLAQPLSQHGAIEPNPAGGDPADFTPVPGLIKEYEPEPIRHIRSYSSFLAPHMGLFTGDTWAIIMTWVRNVSINMLFMFLPLMLLLVLSVRLIVCLYAQLSMGMIIAGDLVARWASLLLLMLGLALYAMSFLNCAVAVSDFRSSGHRPRRAGHSNFYSKTLFPLVIASTIITIILNNIVSIIGEFLAKMDSQRPYRLQDRSLDY